MDMLERLATEVIPVVRGRYRPRVDDEDPYGGRPAFAGRTVPDAAAVIDGTVSDGATVSDDAEATATSGA